MANICQLCGDRGVSNALIGCEKCDAYSIHRYCLDVLPKTSDEYVTWFCDDCELTKPTLDKSKVLTREKSISGSPNEQAWSQSEKKLKKKAKKKVKGESEGLTKSIANAELSASKGSPPNRDAGEGTKGEKQMELDQEDEANSIENTSCFLNHGQSSAEPFVDPVWRESLCVSDKKNKNKLKKKVKDQSKDVNKSTTNVELSERLCGPPNNHLIETHSGVNCEGTKGERQMEMYQEDGAISLESTSYFLSHGQSSAQTHVDPVDRKFSVREKKSIKKGKEKVEDESNPVNKSISKCQGSPSNNHLIDASFGDTREGTKGYMQMELYQGNRAISVENTSYFLDHVELSERLGGPPNNHLIETHSGVNCEGTKGERQMEMYQEDGAISLENTSYFLSHGQSSAQTHVDPVDRKFSVREKRSIKKGKEKVEDESNRVNKSIANADFSKCQGSPSNNHLIDASFGDTREGTKGYMQMELYQGNRAISVENTSYFLDHGHFSAEPLFDPVWRGSLRLTNKKFGTLGLAAHLSSLACSQAEKEAKLLPTVISAELLYRFDVWPKGFAKWGTTDESIALFFFPAKSQENMFKLLIEIMISQDLAMVTEVKNADLLVFTSLSLPVQYHRVFFKFYLWGVFREKKTSNIRKAVNFRDRRDIGHHGRSHASPFSNYALTQAIDRAWEQALDPDK